MDSPPARKRYRAIFISPHLDDAVFSCGGLIAQLVNEGPVLVLNLFTRYLGTLKMHGAVLGVERYEEEAAVANFLGFESRTLGELDAPFRREEYRKIGNLFRPPVAQDIEWLPVLRQQLFAELSQLEYQQLYVPLGVGWHVDHVLAHMVFEPWTSKPELQYYEDAPYCCIPQATRYRLDDIASYAPPPGDSSLLPINELHAWWQAAAAYANTALMKNLQPWIVRKCAVPAVSFYLFRLMAAHRKLAIAAPKRRLHPVLMQINGEVERKVDAMALYGSQFKEFFSCREDCVSMLLEYAGKIQCISGTVERYWINESFA